MKQQRVNYTCPDCGRSYRDVVVPLKCRCKFKRRLDIVLCIHRSGPPLHIVCRGCGGAKEVDVYACDIHGRCHIEPANDRRAGMSCTACAMADEGFSLIPASDAGTAADAAAAQTAAPPQGLADS